MTNFVPIISGVMSDLTATLRFPGQVNSDLRKLAMIAVPLPRLHFLSAGIVPRSFLGTQPTIAELTNDIFDPNNLKL